MVTKPNSGDSNLNIPTSWSDTNTKTRPDSSKVALGWNVNEKPASQYFNWFWNFIVKWLKWAEESIDELESTAETKRQVSQLAHGFLNDFVFYNGSTNLWEKANASSTSTLATHFAERIDVDNFYAYSVGEIDMASVLDEDGISLVDGTVYYLSDSVAGKTTKTRPSANYTQTCFMTTDAKFVLLLETPFLGAKINNDISFDNSSATKAIRGITSQSISLTNTGSLILQVPSSSNAKIQYDAGTAYNIWNQGNDDRTGCVEFFATDSAPSGYLKCNGPVISVTTYANLANKIYCGDALNDTALFGYKCTDPLNPNATRSILGSYIVVPDLRGDFVRAFDDGRGIDSGRVFGSFQQSQAGGYKIIARNGAACWRPDGGGHVESTALNINSVDTTNNSETISRNIALLACIKY